jgi:hypothetical protein
MENFKCDACDKKFKSVDSLEQHNLDKHSNKIKKERTLNFKKNKNWIIFGAMLLFLIWGINSLLSGGTSCDLPAEDMNIGGHSNLLFHIHPDLRIVIEGIEERIPGNIGVGPGVMRPVHTHDSSGELHVEGPCKRDFVLGDFFKIWGKEFSSECLLDKCEGEVKVSVNGIENEEFENLVLKDHDQILIEFENSE